MVARLFCWIRIFYRHTVAKLFYFKFIEPHNYFNCLVIVKIAERNFSIAQATFEPCSTTSWRGVRLASAVNWSPTEVHSKASSRVVQDTILEQSLESQATGGPLVASLGRDYHASAAILAGWVYNVRMHISMRGLSADKCLQLEFLQHFDICLLPASIDPAAESLLFFCLKQLFG